MARIANGLAITVITVLGSAQPYAVMAEIYQWTDDNGHKHFSDRRPDHPHQKTQLPEISIYEMQTPDIPDDSQAREQRNKERLEEKKKQRLLVERTRRDDEKREQLCRKAREDYRSGEGRYSVSPDMDDLKKARRRIDSINDRIKKYCY